MKDLIFIYLHHNARQIAMDWCDSGGKSGLPPTPMAVHRCVNIWLSIEMSWAALDRKHSIAPWWAGLRLSWQPLPSVMTCECGKLWVLFWQELWGVCRLQKCYINAPCFNSRRRCLKKISTGSKNMAQKHIFKHLNELNSETHLSWVAVIDRLCLSPTGGAPEPMSVQWVSTLHPPTLPHQMDQWERLLGLWALLLQISGHCHQH